jgi:hypothetical protein
MFNFNILLDFEFAHIFKFEHISNGTDFNGIDFQI